MQQQLLPLNRDAHTHTHTETQRVTNKHRYKQADRQYSGILCIVKPGRIWQATFLRTQSAKLNWHVTVMYRMPTQQTVCMPEVAIHETVTMPSR